MKFYFANREEWESFCEKNKERKCSTHNINFKKINYPIEIDKNPRPKTAYYPVTLPRTYRRSFTLLKIKNDKIWNYKHVNNFHQFS